MKAKFLSLVVALAGCAVALPAYALTAQDGLTYTLTAFKTSNPDVDNFTLTISGINGTSDMVGGRYGVFALAFNEPAGFNGAKAISTGFTLMSGGLSSGNSGGGCDGTGNFICFQTTQSIVQTALAANSTLSFDFQVDASGISTWGTAGSKDDFKISWDGSNSKNYGSSDFKSGYDHVSENLALTATPAPEIDTGTATAALTLLAGWLAVLRGPRRFRECDPHVHRPAAAAFIM